MSYSIRYSNPNKIIVVQDNALNSETSISFVGKDYTNYAPVIAESFLHLLENFANSTQPINPLPGQLWFNTRDNTLSVFNRALNWKSIGLITTGGFIPTNPVAGELWADTVNNQVKLYTGTEWIGVGPNPSGPVKSGAYVETIIDTASLLHVVILLYSQDVILAIVSGDAAFSPNEERRGFPVIFPGINLSTTITGIQFYGTASSASSLSMNGGVVSADKFVRTDISNILNHLLQIQNNNGILVGQRLDFGMQVIDDMPTIISGLPGSGGDNSYKDINIDLYPQTGTKQTVVKIKSDGKVVIGVDSTEGRGRDTLHINGNVYIAGALTSSGKIVANSPTTEDVATEAELNSSGYNIGYSINSGCLLEGVWVGSSDSVTAPVSVNKYDSNFTAISSYTIMTITADGQYEVIEFMTTADGSSMKEITHAGHINKIRDQCYFRVGDGTNGLALTPVIVNQSYDSLNMIYVGPSVGQRLPVIERPWKTYLYHRVSYETDTADDIINSLLLIARQWPHLP